MIATTSPTIAFCTTCKGRLQHLSQTLPANLADNADYPNCKFVIVDYNCPNDLPAYLRDNFLPEIRSGRVVLYRVPDAGRFQMAHAKNMAHRLGILEGGEILVNLDADNYTGNGFARYIAERFENFRNIVGMMDTGKNWPSLDEEDIFLWSKMNQEESDPLRLPRGISGRIAVSRRAFLKVGGYDERFSTWSPDDKDFNSRLRNMGYFREEIDRRFLSAIRHNDKIRFREYRHAATTLGEDQFASAGNPPSAIVNFGGFGMGTVYRNFSSKATALKAVPTRIFGIGMHKTATSSLHAALKILGIDTAHWKSAHWAKAIWQEITTDGKSPTLERHYALSDLPIGLIYKELDAAYPGSKFILTTRDEASWLRSVEAHFSHEKNKFRASWDHDPFSHKLHRMVYGRKDFDADVFLERFRQHNAEVIAYFRSQGRHGDLLVMDMSNGAGWQELCDFLGQPIPSVPYPKEFQTNAVKEDQ